MHSSMTTRGFGRWISGRCSMNARAPPRRSSRTTNSARNADSHGGSAGAPDRLCRCIPHARRRHIVVGGVAVRPTRPARNRTKAVMADAAATRRSLIQYGASSPRSGIPVRPLGLHGEHGPNRTVRQAQHLPDSGPQTTIKHGHIETPRRDRSARRCLDAEQ